MSTDIESWLDTLGLGQYAATFAANAIDLDIVGDLTDADLVTLGVTALGHRKRLLNAVAARQQPRIDNFIVGLESLQSSLRGRHQAERRQVTVLFCDLVGSTELASRLDPEELAPIIDRYHATAGETVRQMGGHVARLLGDGVMALFGWPTVREDDAERAVAVGLELIEQVSRLPTQEGETLAVRVGVATGLVAIGYGVEGGDGGISGDTPNIAARLQGEAAPNGMVVSPLTARLAGRSFRYRSLGERQLRGIGAPIEIFEVSGARSSLNRFKALRARSTAPLVGRSEEVELLLSRWRRANASEGQVVLLSGDAGIGKSRLLQTMRERIGNATVLSYQCSPLHQDMALFPVVHEMSRAVALDGKQTPEQKVARVVAWLHASGLEPGDDLPLLCHLLNIDSPAHRLSGVAPRQIRERMVAMLSRQFFSLARTGPVLAIVEDVQWIDPTMEDLLIDIQRSVGQSRAMLFATSRDPFSSRWHVAGHTIDLRLDRLSGADSRRLIHAIAGDRLSDAVQAGIATRAEGVPLYLEELTLTLIESGQSPELREVPTSLHALLAARLDKLAEAKPLLQVGSVFGRQFAVADLQAVSGCDDAELRAMIDRSVGAGLLQEAERGNDKILAFKHALVQDAAYGGLLNSEKRRLHGTVLAHFEKHKDWLSAGAGLAVLASHAERGEVWDKAARYLIASLDQAIRSSANHEAVALYDRTLKALEQLPPSASAAPAVDARLHVFSPLLALGQIERLVEVMHQATALAHELGDKRRMAATTSQLASALWLAGKHATGLRSAEEAVRLANELDDFVLRLSARFNQANLLHATGEIGDAARLYGEIIDSLPGELQLKRFGWPGIPSVLSRGLLTWSLVTLGDFERARRTKDEAMALVDRVREPYSMVYAYMGQGLYFAAVGKAAEAIESFEAAHRITQQADIVLPISTAWLGAAYVQGGRATDALALLLDAERKSAYRSGGLYNSIHHYSALAQAHLAVGDLAAAYTAISRAEEIAEETGEMAHLASALCIRGAIEAADPATLPQAAAACYRRAIEIARPRGLRPLIATALVGLARSSARAGDDATAATHEAEASRLNDELGLVLPR
ncbi:adenylate/guanylate cyclase domain-containing protein [Reyranella sp.]|uniref:adenylate/guanylate cyclase domain-containing protein n=1 Tax=Reyranella sp. TaxID=1929291 RepID=UPI003BAA5E49